MRTEGAPPGAANGLLPNFLWHMPPRNMIIRPGISPAQLCQQWINPQNTGSALEPNRGGRNDLRRFEEQFINEHVVKDPLIIWGWNPGDGRRKLPGSHNLFVTALRQWVRAGAPCQ